MKTLLKLILINSLWVSGVSSSLDESQKLIENLWANRVIKAENLKPGIKKLETKVQSLSDKQRAELNNLKAYVALLNGNIKRAIEISNKVIQENLSYDLYARAKNIQVNALVFNGDIKGSFREMYDLLDNFGNIESDDLKLNILHSAVIRHLYADIFDKAIELSKRNIALSKSLKLNHYYCLAQIEAANIELALNNFEQAKAELLLANLECEKHNATIFRQFIQYKLAKIAFENGEYANAKEKLINIYNENKNKNYKVLRLEVAILLANTLIELNESKKSLDLAKEAFDFANDNDYLYLKRDSAEVLAKYFKLKRKTEEFNKYRNIYRESLIKLKTESNYRIAQYYSAIQTREKQTN